MSNLVVKCGKPPAVNLKHAVAAIREGQVLCSVFSQPWAPLPSFSIKRLGIIYFESASARSRPPPPTPLVPPSPCYPHPPLHASPPVQRGPQPQRGVPVNPTVWATDLPPGGQWRNSRKGLKGSHTQGPASSTVDEVAAPPPPFALLAPLSPISKNSVVVSCILLVGVMGFGLPILQLPRALPGCNFL